MIDKNVHIGSLIREKLEEKDLSIGEFAQRINRTRTTVYDIFNRKSIDIDLLINISEVLGYNFLEEVYMAKYQDSSSYIVGVEISGRLLFEESVEEGHLVFRIRKK